MNKKCLACNPSAEYKKLDIKEYKYWLIGLHANQAYLGRSVIILKRHLEDIFDISLDEREELFTITKQLRESLSINFQPDRFNYATLGNEVSHVHLHVIPRYKHERIFIKTKFIDERWGKNYSPYNKQFTVSENILQNIVTTLKKSLP